MRLRNSLQRSYRKQSLLALAALGGIATVLWRKKSASPPEGKWRDLSVVDGGDG